MPRTIYHDFHLAIEAADSGPGFVTRILRSPEGRAKAIFEPPGPEEALENRSHRQRVEGKGRALFRSLFAGEIGQLFRQSLARLQGASQSSPDIERVLRVRVAIDPKNPRLAPLLDGLDLEVLYDEDSGSFITRSRTMTLIRDLEAARPLEQKVAEPTLRILLVAPLASGAQDLDGDGEEALIEKAWRESTDVEIEKLAQPTFRALQRRLRRGRPVHILHFLGHGHVCDAENEGILHFEDEEGELDEISAARFADLLRGYRPLRLVVLNACESGRGPKGFPARGVAAALIGAGVPAAVALRSFVPDKSAVHFSHELYDALADGKPIDEAMTQARMAIDETEETFRHWSAPALFMSSTDGQLLDRRPDDAPIRLGIRTRMHPFSSLDDWDHLLDLVPLFDGRSVADEGSWSEKIEPNLDYFLRQHVQTDRPVILRLDAHLTVAFAAGRIVDTRGVNVTLHQARLLGFEAWRPDLTSPWSGPLWKKTMRRRPWRGDDWAVCLGVTNEVAKDASEYVEGNLTQVGRFISWTPATGVGDSVIHGAEHALALAQEVKVLALSRNPKKGTGVLHLFLAAPGAFAFYLGQLSRGWGEIQLYEFEFEKSGFRTYRPSLRIVPEPNGRG